MQRTTLQSPAARRSMLGQNLFWFGASLVLAFLVWMVANPIEQQPFPNIPIQIDPGPDMLVVERSLTTATVFVRAQRSVLDLLTPQDIAVEVDLSRYTPGTYTVDLSPQVARRAAADTQPRRITVVLEALQSKLVAVQANITQETPIGYQRDAPAFDAPEILVSGASSRVEQVVAVRATFDLSQQRATLTQTYPVVPINARGEVVPEVTLEPQSVQVTVPIRRREDVLEVSITPNLATASLPEGYIISSLGYEPQTVFVSGNLALIPDSLFTQRIALQDRTEDFVTTVPVVLPSRDLLILGVQEITVSVGISALTITRTFENLPVTVIGLGDGLEAQMVTNQVTVLITGPQVVLDTLARDDLQVVLDLNNLEPDTYELAPVVTNSQIPLDSSSVSVLPDTISVSLVRLADLTATPTLPPTPRP